MSESRKPVSDVYDAVVDLGSSAELGPYAYLLVKFTYDVSGGSCVLTAPEPLRHDIRDENLQPRLKAGTDFWVDKIMTDVVVRGSAFALSGIPTTEMNVSVQVGSFVKRISVFGRRKIIWDKHGKPRIEDPEPFLEMPLTYENAYGGIDWRVPVENADSLEMQVILQTDHPGMYPRNPFGKGYLVVDGEVPEMEMPNLEDPEDLLTEERIITKKPELWYKQPLPWCFDWVHPYTFPRYIYFYELVDAWFPGPEDENMPEVKRGFLPPGYRSVMKGRGFDEGPHPMFYQEASYGMSFAHLNPGEKISISGMNQEKEVVSFNLPSEKPLLEIEIEGNREAVEPKLTSVECFPGEEKVSLVYVAIRELHRLFVPGIHKHIPVKGFVDGGMAIEYEAPPTMKEKLDHAKEEHEKNA